MTLPLDLTTWPEPWRELFEERAGILEFTANYPRWKAEVMAEADIRKLEQEQSMKTPTLRTIKALSLWQPWAEAMRRKLKKNETRSWFSDHRGWLGIHAAKKKFNPNEYEPEFAHECRAQNIWPDSLTYGAMVCIVRMVGCEKTERILDRVSEREKFWGNYEPDRFAWMTDPTNLIELPAPVPFSGHQGLFNWELPPTIAEMIRAKEESSCMILS